MSRTLVVLEMQSNDAESRFLNFYIWTSELFRILKKKSSVSKRENLTVEILTTPTSLEIPIFKVRICNKKKKEYIRSNWFIMDCEVLNFQHS